MLELGEQAGFFQSARPLASPMTPTPEVGQVWIGAQAAGRNHGSHHRAPVPLEASQSWELAERYFWPEQTSRC